MILRDYQVESLNNTRNLFKTNKRVLTVLPCGAGKTVEFAQMCVNHVSKNENNYVWFLVHRKELIEQAEKTFRDNNLPLDNILIAMVQTVTRHIPEYHKPTLIVFDEAHHATAKQWTNIINYYSNVPVVGLTATPARLDGKPLGDIFEALTVGISANELIELGYLSPYDYYAPNINLEDAQYKMRGSDFDMEDVAEQFDKRAIYGDVIKYIDLNRKTIIYSPNIDFSMKLANEINRHFNKLVAAHFDGNTHKLDRAQIISDFRNGNLRVLTNVDLIGEGFDVPDCDCCILLRPTQSLSLYIQQSMRCLRPGENKRAVIYDLVGNVFRHGMPTDDRKWSLKKKIKTRNPSGEKDVITRMCENCFRIYPGTSRICPYCHHDNGKTRKQIEEEQEAELVKITELKKKQERREVGMCRDLESLIALGKKRGYKNPVYWARTIINARERKI